MGYYIQGPTLGKAEFLIKQHGATRLTGAPEKLANLPPDKAVVCVVHNGPFEAAAHAFSQKELEDFIFDGTNRKKEWLLMDAKLVEKLSSGEVDV